MIRIPALNDFVEEVRRRSCIVEVVGQDTKLERRGRAWVGLSPLRKEKTPSFNVYKDDQRAHDFGDGWHGDVFAYVMARDRCDFMAALDTLAKRAGLSRPSMGGGNVSEEDQKWREAALEMTATRRLRALTTLLVLECHRYMTPTLRRRVAAGWGLTDETIDREKIGWCTGGLYEFARAEGYTEEECLSTGFFFKLGTAIECHLLHRIVYPYWQGGQVVYAIGRQHEPPDYVPADYDKSKFKKLLTHDPVKRPYVSPWVRNVLYNEDVFRKGALEEVFFPEGIADTLVLIQNGFPSASHITTNPKAEDLPAVVELCKRVKIVYIVPDNDELEDGRRPGLEGAMAFARALFIAGIDVRIVTLPRPPGSKKVDVCDYFLAEAAAGRDPKAGFLELVKKARRYVDELMQQIPTSLEGVELERRLEPVIDLVAHSSMIAREDGIRRISERFKLGRRAVRMLVDAKRPPEEKKKRDRAEKLRGHVLERDNLYYVETPTGDEEIISDFVLLPKKIIIDDAGNELLCTDVIDTNHDKIVSDFVWPKAAWVSRRNFASHLPSPKMHFTGNDDQLVGTRRIIMLEAANVPRIRSVGVIGYHETPDGPRYVVPNGTIGPDGWIDDPTLVYAPSGKQIAKRLEFTKTTPAEDRELAAQVLPELFNVNAPDVMVAALGFAYACVYKPRIDRVLGHFPSLNVWGTQGSGKTSLVQMLWHLQGVGPNASPFATKESAFVRALHWYACNTIPSWHDEFNPDLEPYERQGYTRSLRRTYSGESEERGRPDQTSNELAYNAPVITSGEVKIDDDAALAERIIPASPKKNRITSSAAAASSRMAYAKIARLPLWRLAAPYAQWSLTQDVPAMLAEARKTIEQTLVTIDRAGSPRIIDNLTVMAMGLLSLERWATSLGVELPAIDFATSLRTIIDSILGRDDDLADGTSGSVRDGGDSLLEEAGTAAGLGVLKEGPHYSYEGGALLIHLRSVIPTLEAWLRTRGVTKALNLKALRRMYKEKLERGDSYVLELDRRVQVGTRRTRWLALDVAKMTEMLGIEEFPQNKTKDFEARWGTGSKQQTGWGTHGGDAE